MLRGPWFQMATSPDTISQIETAQTRMERWKKIGFVVVLVLVIAFAGFAWLRPLTLVRTAGRLALWRGGIHGHYAQVGPYRVHYYEGGDGPPLVFVHGLGAESLNWVPAMLDLRGQFHVYAIDLLGHGDTQKPDIAYSIEQQSEMLRQFLATQNIKSADLVGVSMGGWVVLKLAIDHPEVVNRLVVADAAGLRFPTSITVKNFLPATPVEFAAFMAMLTPRHYYVPLSVQRDFLRQVAEHAWITRRIFDSFLTYQDVLDGKLQEIKAPVLVIWGKEEKLIPLSVGEQMRQQLPNSSLVVCSDSGHLAVYECWDKLEPNVAAFLSSPSPAAPYVREVSTGERAAAR
jgi:pimeloyl-ACP methyl ester carboxylesterase